MSGCVLIVEDHRPTSALMTTAFDEVSPAITCRVVETGEDAMAVLAGENEPEAVPDLVLLDLDLPGMDGYAVLEALERDERLRALPVVVVSDITERATIDRCYELGARTFVSKPNDLNGFLSFAETLTDYWFRLATRPSKVLTDGNP